MIPKNKPGRSEEYLDYIRILSCCVCQETAEPHHTGKAGVGMKSSDFSAIPMCRTHHRELHDSGIGTFQEKYDISIAVAVAVRLVVWCDMNYTDEVM